MGWVVWLFWGKLKSSGVKIEEGRHKSAAFHKDKACARGGGARDALISLRASGSGRPRRPCGSRIALASSGSLGADRSFGSLRPWGPLHARRPGGRSRRPHRATPHPRPNAVGVDVADVRAGWKGKHGYGIAGQTTSSGVEKLEGTSRSACRYTVQAFFCSAVKGASAS
jgi:hypothetical protein